MYGGGRGGGGGGGRVMEGRDTNFYQMAKQQAVATTLGHMVKVCIVCSKYRA